MGYSGKASKGCLPCREKRTKCDLAQPSCTQCIRKNRECTGYREEQDIVFKNETPQVVRKTRLKKKHPQPTPAATPAEHSFAQQYPSVLVQRPSRRVGLNNEAVLHFLGHYNEKFFASFGRTGGVDYMTPVFQSDTARGGPVAEIITACGLATLGAMKGSPDLVTAARVRQTKVLRLLQQQLQDPNTALTNSSVLTCLFLSSFEVVSCSGPQSMQAYTEHLKGAVILAGLRGRSQFADSIGHGLYVRVRGMLIMQCLQAREPLPDFVLEFMGDEELAKREFEAPFIRLLIRSCQLLSDHKTAGSMNEALAREAQALMDDWLDWRPIFGAWGPGERPSTKVVRRKTDPDEIYHIVWLAIAYLFQQSTQILISDLQIEWTRSQYKIIASPETSLALEEAINAQLTLCDTIKDSVVYYMDDFSACQAATRTMGAHSLLWPLSILLSISTTTPDHFVWSAKRAAKIAEVFGLKQAQMVADMIWMGVQASPSYITPLETSNRDTSNA
ncbi:hypothetical protein K458DRAFT_24221 [Lentithecium fluviatile CBS 122367]|uniref:Zn(2)-C6 fungal-type domain-containing protein n=1 Tax=Lentithecium fluviatile CBS 122367 TaxID=1168545 RepID=A0A6G1J5A3_9PLEO|nr:hypothetical protein K458DRAFT_24221 [Lentithecium fluviatile CBS 122367]